MRTLTPELRRGDYVRHHSGYVGKVHAVSTIRGGMVTVRLVDHPMERVMVCWPHNLQLIDERVYLVALAAAELTGGKP